MRRDVAMKREFWRKTGRCRDCGAAAEPAKSGKTGIFCGYHRDVHKARGRAWYLRKQTAGECRRAGCRRPEEPGFVHCASHVLYQRETNLIRYYRKKRGGKDEP